jgi:hypothetical protein
MEMMFALSVAMMMMAVSLLFQHYYYKKVNLPK